MAPRPDTTTGTITLTNGLTAFTTVGTNMITRGHLPGDTIRRNGLVLTIAAITGENTGTLEDPCPAGAAGAGVPVRIRWQADGSRVAAQTRNMIDVLGNGNLQSFAGLVGATNTFPRFTGLATLDIRTAAQMLADIGAQPVDIDLQEIAALTTQAFGRSLLTAANAAAARALLLTAAEPIALGSIVSGTGPLVLALPAGYRSFEFRLTAANFTASAIPYVRISNDNAATFPTTNYFWQSIAGAGATAAAEFGGTVSDMRLTGSTAVTPRLSSVIDIDPGGNGGVPSISSLSSYLNSVSAFRSMQATGAYLGSATRATHIAIIPAGTTWVSGEYSLLGFR